jgi:hypothetical protein
VQLPVARAHTGKVTSAALRSLARTDQERCFSAPARDLCITNFARLVASGTGASALRG